MIYHIDPQSLTIIAGPFAPTDTYVRKLTRCGTPEVLGLAQYDLVPEVKPPLGQYQSYGEPVVSTDAVTLPVIDWTAEQIAACEAEQLAQRRAALSCTPRQARLALHEHGILNAVEDFVQAGDSRLYIEWNYATEIRRTWPPVAEFAAANDISDETLDGLFELAMTL